MASEKFGPHLPTILDAKHIEAIYELWGVDYAVEIELPGDGETLEIVRPGYCGAYMSHFEDEGLSFPLPRFLLEALAELGMAFAQVVPNFFCYFLASWVRAREEGLEFGLGELKQLFAIKRNSGFHGTMILAPRAGRSIIDGIPNKDDRWREKFFVFKINPASPFGSAPMTPELRGLSDTLRRGNPRWLAFTVDRIRAAYALLPGENRVTPIGLAAPVRPGKGCRNKRAREKEALPDHPEESSEAGPVSIAVPVVSSNLPRSGLPPPMRASSKGTSRVDPSAHLPEVQETSSWRFSYDNKVPILENPEQHDAYVRMAVANAKLIYPAIASDVMEASNEYAALMEKRLADFLSKEEAGSHLLTIQQLREKHRREIEGRDAAVRKECDLARRSLAREYDAVLAVVKDKLQKKKKETAAEIRLDWEISLDVGYGLASVSDPSLSHLELPDVSGDSVDQD
ncbi:hypothetical protein Bca52824_053696 [Brassica carinata]|uniref:Uncharacterized protein n=1 Tax=Brassica carinata TaxID=52824 RepID=A0A8X7R647_BRACI|nr:hypothetical protein Bca52824_053696 [Brassica carinata]